MKSVLKAGKYAIRRGFAPIPGGLSFLRNVSRWTSGAPHPDIDANSRTLIVMVHIPKTGGTSFAHVLRKIYGNRFLDISGLRKDWETRRPNPDKILCLSGHFPYGWHRKLGAKRGRATDLTEVWPTDGLFEGRRILYLSIVRDPVDRILSTYRYARRLGEHKMHAEAVRRSPEEFVQYLEELWPEHTWNLQAHMLRGLPEDRFFLCAPLPQLEEFISVLGRVLDWPGEIQAPHLNDTRAIRHDPINEKLRAKIKSLVSRDQELYENVSKRFAQRDFPAFDGL